MVARPVVMLVDEPTEGLAPILVQNLTEILAQINGRGTTILLVEQTLEVALALSHRLYVMDQGRIGPPPGNRGSRALRVAGQRDAGPGKRRRRPVGAE
jgi:ABC-type polar amino acid transport system ATPase subunit